MKRSPFKTRPRPSLKKSSLSRGVVKLRRGQKLRIVGKSDTATLKKEIQAVLREIVMLRDRGCILRGERDCGGELDAKGVVLQADHIITRSNSATYADSRLVCCVCKRCHAWKSLSTRGKTEYDALLKIILPEDRVKLWEACEADSWKPKRTTSMDWALALVSLKQELKALGGGLETIRY